MHQDVVQVGTELVYSDDRVRVWTLQLEPGEETSIHQHPCDYVFVVTAQGKTETVTVDGDIDPGDDHLGKAVYHHVGPPHLLRNVGTTSYSNIIVELLETGR
jgi:quercetin dioxygenase-like cupin family protein